MKLFAILPIFTASVPIGGMDFSSMNTDGFDQMMMTFKPMFKTFYNAMDHRQSMADFKLDDNGMFKRYFSFCDEGKTGELTPDNHAACKTRIREQMKQKLSEFGIEIPDEEKAKTMMEKFDAMNKDMFDEYVDGNGDGSATIEEIEMGGYCMFRVTAQMMIKMMDKNDDGKIDNSEMSYDFDFEEYGFVTADAQKIVNDADLDNDGAYDERELTKVMFDMTDMMIQKIFN